ncbi:hypothetical protein LTR53_018547, partial [Teratosphaeriaceae sp. CCFEE 6253]
AGAGEREGEGRVSEEMRRYYGLPSSSSAAAMFGNHYTNHNSGTSSSNTNHNYSLPGLMASGNGSGGGGGVPLSTKSSSASLHSQSGGGGGPGSGSTSRLPTPKPRNVHSSSSSRYEDAGFLGGAVPPVPAIPKAFESPMESFEGSPFFVAAAGGSGYDGGLGEAGSMGGLGGDGVSALSVGETTRKRSGEMGRRGFLDRRSATVAAP